MGPHLHKRVENNASMQKRTDIAPVYAAGFAIAALILLLGGVWLLVRLRRKRGRTRGEISSSNETRKERRAFPLFHPPYFHRALLTSSVVFPNKAPVRPLSSNHDLDASTLNVDMSNAPKWQENSARDRVSSRASLKLPRKLEGTTQTIRRLYSPLRPDELQLSRLGETVTVLTSFDDGWCMISRAKAAQGEVRLGHPPDPRDDDTEVGLVPAWCLIEAMDGHEPAERPRRGTSLSVALQVEAQRKQDHAIEWSHFA